jgi:hypothetical protein
MIPRELFGKWTKEGSPLLNVLSQKSNQLTGPDKTRTADWVSQSANGSVKATDMGNEDLIELISYDNSNTHTNAVPGKKDNPTEPTREEFLVLANKPQHDAMVNNLIRAGIRPAEAEQVIALRKTAFTKALKVLKKNPVNGTKLSQKKTRRSLKNQSQSLNDCDN